MPRMTYQNRNDAEINTCDVVAQIVFRHFMYRLSRNGEDVLVTQGHRGKVDQEADFAKGVSHVHYPYSFHNHDVAIDVVPVLFGQTKIIYKADARYELIARIAAQCNLDWGFKMWNFDKPHFQYTQGHDINFFINGGVLDVTAARTAAMQYYNEQLSQIMLAMQFAHGGRINQLSDEIAYVRTLIASLK